MERIFRIFLFYIDSSLCLRWRECLIHISRKTEICGSELFHDNNGRLPMFFHQR